MAPRHPPHDWITVLLLVSLAPISIFLGILVTFSNSVSRVVGHRGKLLPLLDQQRRKRIASSRERILISGSSSPALNLARALHSLGYVVLLTDYERIPLLHHARCSRAIAEFIPFPRKESFWNSMKRPKETIPSTFSEHVVEIIRSRNIGLWLPCGAPAAGKQTSLAREAVLSSTNCQVLYPSSEIAQLAENNFAFANYVDGLNSAIKVPGTFEVTTRGEVHKLLGAPPHRRKFSLSEALPSPRKKRVCFEEPVKESHWRDSGFSESYPDSPPSERERETDYSRDSIRLPLNTADDTYGLLASIPISSEAPRIVSEIVEGKHCGVAALIMDGRLVAFAAYRLADVLTYSRPRSLKDELPQVPAYELPLRVLSPSSPLNFALKEFTETFVSSLSGKTCASLRLRFVLSETGSKYGAERRLWTIGCNFKQPPYLTTSSIAAGRWATSLVRASKKGTDVNISALDVTTRRTGIYSFPTDLYSLLLLPILKLLVFQQSLAGVAKSSEVFLEHVTYWNEALFDWKDLGPWIWMWLVQVPIQAFVGMISGISVNVHVRIRRGKS
jgi:hypothetical protein